MRLIDEQYLKTPFYGSRRMTAWLVRRGEEVNRKRVQRLIADFHSRENNQSTGC
jgi:putative transposase